jgi:hypothetical protein
MVNLANTTVEHFVKAVRRYIPDGREPKMGYGFTEPIPNPIPAGQYPIANAIALDDDQQLTAWLNIANYKPIHCIVVLKRPAVVPPGAAPGAAPRADTPNPGVEFYRVARFEDENLVIEDEPDSDYDESRPLKPQRYGLPRTDKGWITQIDRIERRIQRQIEARESLIKKAKIHGQYEKYLFGGEYGYRQGLSADAHREKKAVLQLHGPRQMRRMEAILRRRRIGNWRPHVPGPDP